MTAGRRGVGLTPMETRRDVIVRAAVLADELGYEVFAVPEGWGLDSTPVLAEIALRTTRIHLASGVLSVWGRTPVTLAMTAAALHQACGGRYVLGLGASTKALPEGFHGTPFDHPAAKLRDVVAKVRALLAGQPAQLHHTPAARPLRLGRPLAPEVPIWVAALGDHTARVAAELGDGWIPALVARDHLPAWTAQLNELRATTTPHAKALTVAAGPITAVDEDAGAARGIAAGCTAWYVSAMGEVYARSVSGNGYAAQVQAIIAANPRPSPRRGTVPPGAQAVLGQLAAYGTCDQVREQLQTWDRAADIVTILLPPGLAWHNIEATLRAAAPDTAAKTMVLSRAELGRGKHGGCLRVGRPRGSGQLWPGRPAQRGGPTGSGRAGYPTAFSASSSPEPYQLLWPAPPWQVCRAPPSRAGKKSYADVSLGHGIGLVTCSSAAERALPVLPVALSNSAATPTACGDAIDVPCW